MKKLIYTALCLLIVQLSMAQGGAFGPRVSVVSTNLSLSENIAQVQEGDAEFGYQFGVFARLKLGPVMLMPELLFTDTQSTVSQNNTQVDFDFNKIDLPILLGVKFLFLRLQAGPTLSFLTSADQTIGGVTEDIIDNYNSTTVGYQAGVGMDLLNLLAIDLKYEGNLSNFADALPGFINTDQRQNQIVLAVGLKLISRKKN